MYVFSGGKAGEATRPHPRTEAAALRWLSGCRLRRSASGRCHASNPARKTLKSSSHPGSIECDPAPRPAPSGGLRATSGGGFLPCSAAPSSVPAPRPVGAPGGLLSVCRTLPSRPVHRRAASSEGYNVLREVEPRGRNVSLYRRPGGGL